VFRRWPGTAPEGADRAKPSRRALQLRNSQNDLERQAASRGVVLTVDLCIIGAGPGGLTLAAGAAQMGARTVLVEKQGTGGGHLGGCVPSKAMLAAGHAVHAAGLGHGSVGDGRPAVDWSGVRAYVHGVVAARAPNDSVERLQGLGVQVMHGTARFVAPDAIAVDGIRVQARRFVIATGSAPVIPPIPGLGQIPYLTTETVFDNSERPAHLIVLGGGAVALELAQAHARLGSRVTVIHADGILGSEDSELTDVVRRRLTAEGIVIHEQATVRSIAGHAGDIVVETDIGGLLHPIAGSHLLIADRRRANLDDLDLDKAGIEISTNGLVLDARLRTTNKRVFAIGDAAGGAPSALPSAPASAHAAGYHAGIVLRNALFRLPVKVDHTIVPRVTYTVPELASVGSSAEEARARYRQIQILRWPFAETDRAHADGDIDGMVKVIATARGRVLGAAIVGRAAGELILPWVFAVRGKLSLGDMAQVAAPHPTLSEASKQAAGSFYAARLFNPTVRRLVRALSWFG
jgi:pyruvate/2-oxoglutarate dehydrogenase complex dihydrolipoamide dehydrogenase (E3) component